VVVVAGLTLMLPLVATALPFRLTVTTPTALVTFQDRVVVCPTPMVEGLAENAMAGAVGSGSTVTDTWAVLNKLTPLMVLVAVSV
jgi:hypothetical protein